MPIKTRTGSVLSTLTMSTQSTPPTRRPTQSRRYQMSFAPGRSSVLGSVKSFVTLVAIIVLGFAALAAYMTFGQPKAATPAADTSTVGSAVHSATPVAAPAAEAAVAVEKVKSSEGSARQVLVKDYGVTCTVASHLSIAVPADLPESIDAKVAQAKLSGD